MANRRCAYKDPETARPCHIFCRGGSKYCIHHSEAMATTMTLDEKLALLEHEMRCVRHKNAVAIERGKLLLALMEVHGRLSKEAPAVADNAGVEDETPGAVARKKLMAAVNRK